MMILLSATTIKSQDDSIPWQIIVALLLAFATCGYCLRFTKPFEAKVPSFARIGIGCVGSLMGLILFLVAGYILYLKYYGIGSITLYFSWVLWMLCGNMVIRPIFLPLFRAIGIAPSPNPPEPKKP